VKGFVYILVNSAFPNLIKIGRTTKSPQNRSQELSSTGTPGRFVVAYSVFVENCIELEYEMHSQFSKQRHSAYREFFEIECSVAINKLIELSKDKIADENQVNVEAPDFFVATFYLLTISRSRNLYRLGIIVKPRQYLYEEKFKKDIIDLYTNYDSNFFYECEPIKCNEFINIDIDCLDKMRHSIVHQLSKLRSNNNSIKRLDSFDENTLLISTDEVAVPLQVYKVVLSVVETDYKKFQTDNFNVLKQDESNLRKKQLEDKLKSIGGG